MSDLTKKLKHQSYYKALVIDMPDEVIVDISHDSKVISEGYHLQSEK